MLISTEYGVYPLYSVFRIRNELGAKPGIGTKKSLSVSMFL